ncbi:MAG: hypothetical protein Q4F31_01885 [Eubacteriales bacterium]|nr:hypothetical protein [Eubacteriales bacterium]
MMRVIPENKKKKIVTIVIEVANRELDNAILLKTELEKRGYAVRIMSKTEELRKTPTDILVTPNCYIKPDYDFYRYRFNCPSGMLVNLQYEQVLSPIEEDNELYSLDDTSKGITHICWGRHTVDRLTGKGVAKENLPVTGAIQLDTTRPMFDSRWKTRSEISDEFNLDQNKKWILYISSFATTSGGLINEVQKLTHTEDNVDRFSKITDESQAETLLWFDRFLSDSDNSGYLVIYRPHPVELSSPIVNSLREKYPDSFRVIQDYEVKQWIRVSDIPCTWLSTAISESYFSGKNCLVFRPYEIPWDIDCVIFNDVRSAKTYEEFLNEIKFYNPSLDAFPIDRKLIEYYYNFSLEPAFRKIADVIDSQRPRISDTETFEGERKAYLRSGHIPLKLSVKRLYRTWYRATGKKLKNERLRSKFFVEEWEKTVDNRINSAALISEKEKIFRDIIDR